MKIHRYHCQGDGSKKCSWLSQIREYNKPNKRQYFEVFRHTVHSVHCHPIDSGPVNPVAARGLNPEILAIVSNFVSKHDGTKVIMNVKPKKMLSRLISHSKKHRPDLAHQLRESKYRDKVHEQLRGYFYRKQEAYLKQCLSVSSITNN